MVIRRRRRRRHPARSRWRRRHAWHPRHPRHVVRHVTGHPRPAFRQRRIEGRIPGRRRRSIVLRSGVFVVAFPITRHRHAAAAIGLHARPPRAPGRAHVHRTHPHRTGAFVIVRSIARVVAARLGPGVSPAGRRRFRFIVVPLARGLRGGIGVLDVAGLARFRAGRDERADQPTSHPDPRLHGSPRHAAAPRGWPARSVAGTGPGAERNFADMRDARGLPCHRKRSARPSDRGAFGNNHRLRRALAATSIETT